jgi:hypothetical protein
MDNSNLYYSLRAQGGRPHPPSPWLHPRLPPARDATSMPRPHSPPFLPGKESAPPLRSPLPAMAATPTPRDAAMPAPALPSPLRLALETLPPPQPAPPPPCGLHPPSSLPRRFPAPSHRASPGSAPKTPPRCPRFLPPTPVACLTPRHGSRMVNPSLRPRIPQPLPPSSPLPSARHCLPSRRLRCSAKWPSGAANPPCDHIPTRQQPPFSHR